MTPISRWRDTWLKKLLNENRYQSHEIQECASMCELNYYNFPYSTKKKVLTHQEVINIIGHYNPLVRITT